MGKRRQLSKTERSGERWGIRNRLRRIAIEHAAGDDDAHDFVGAFQNLVHAGVAQQALQRVFADSRSRRAVAGPRSPR